MKTIKLIFIAGVLSMLYVFTQLHALQENRKDWDNGWLSTDNVERIRMNLPKEPVQRLAADKRTLPPIVHPDELLCLQKNIYFEARNQSLDGQLAVAWVTVNRVVSDRYPNSVCDVVYQGAHKNGVPKRNRCKFSWYCDGKSDEPDMDNALEYKAWQDAEILAEAMIKHCLIGYENYKCPSDNTEGALYYHSHTVSPKWSAVYTHTATVDDHLFYAPN